MAADRLPDPGSDNLSQDACPKCGMPGAAHSTHVCMTAGDVPDPPATRWLNPPVPAAVSPAEPPEDRWHGLYAGTANDQAMVNREALARLLREHEAAVEKVRRHSETLRLIFGLLAHRRWWNGNVAAAYQLAKEALLDVR